MLKCNLPWLFKIIVVFNGYMDRTKLKQFSLLISTNWLKKVITNSNASSQDAKSPLLFFTLCILQNSSVYYIYSNIMFPRKKNCCRQFRNCGIYACFCNLISHFDTEKQMLNINSNAFTVCTT